MLWLGGWMDVSGRVEWSGDWQSSSDWRLSGWIVVAPPHQQQSLLSRRPSRVDWVTWPAKASKVDNTHSLSNFHIFIRLSIGSPMSLCVHVCVCMCLGALFAAESCMWKCRVLEAVNMANPSCGVPSGDRRRYRGVWGRTGRSRLTRNLGLHTRLFIGAEQLSLDGLHHALETPAWTW